MNAAPFLSLVIPAYNESRRIERSIRDLQAFFRLLKINMEILIVIEKSSDHTVELAKNLIDGDPLFRIIANDVHKGKGFAVKTGMLQARGELVFFMDLDLSTPLVEVVSFISEFQQRPDVDIIIGSRKHKESQVIKKQTLIRRKMGQIFNLFVQALAVKGITDTQCGFKAFRKHTVKPIFSRQTIDGFSFDVEILLLAEALGYKIHVKPVKWINSPESKVHIIKDSIKMLVDLLKMKRLVSKTLHALPPTEGEKAKPQKTLGAS
ncbi:MAG: glycosyltransferase family 2 protein [Oligoflexia bacterium]|nr:glycosyltransferase family 2 protein [Oligoflexia bacterium]